MDKEDVDFLISIQDLEQPDFDNACLERENTRLQQELQRKDNIINELKKWLNEPHITYSLDASEFGIEKIECVSVKDTLNKIKEIESK